MKNEKLQLSHSFIIFASIILMTGCSNGIVFDKQEDTIGEITCNELDIEHINNEVSGLMYVDNEILVVADQNASRKEIESIAKKYDSEIVGCIEMTGDYELQLQAPLTKEELEQLIVTLESEELIEDASINYVTTVNEQSFNVNYGNQWNSENWNENEPEGLNWGLEAINAKSAWDLLSDRGITSDNAIRLGLIDDGFYEQHEDLNFAEVFLNNTPYEHGTQVAGIMAATSTNEEGICGTYPFGAGNLYGVSIKGVMANSENAVSCMLEKCAFAELILRDVKVINCSYGYEEVLLKIGLYNDVDFKNEINRYTRELASFFQRLLDKGYDFTIVQASGNASNCAYATINDSYAYDENGEIKKLYYHNANKDSYYIVSSIEKLKAFYVLGDDDKYHKVKNLKKSNIKIASDLESTYCSFLTYIDKKEFPNVYDRIIVVGAIGLDSKTYKETMNSLCSDSHSVGLDSYGYHMYAYGNKGTRLDVYAPGEHIYTCLKNVNEYSGESVGTSLAAPFVSGVAALVWTANSNLNGAEVKNIICESADSMSHIVGYSIQTTDYKLVNACSAVKMALNIEENTLSKPKVEFGGVLNYIVDSTDEQHKISGATITAIDSEGNMYDTTSDSEGHFELIVPGGEYTLTIQATGYEDYIWNSVEVENEGVNYLSDWTKMVPLYCHGNLIDDNTGAVISEASIIITNSEGIVCDECFTTEEGIFISKLPAGSYAADISKNGYDSIHIEFAIENGKSTDLGHISMSSSIIDVKDYLNDIQGLIDVLGLSNEDSYGGISASTDLLSIGGFSSGDGWMITNKGDKCVKLFDISTGDSTDIALENIKSYGSIYCRDMSDNLYLGLVTKNNQFMDIYLMYDSDKKITSWSVNYGGYGVGGFTIEYSDMRGILELENNIDLVNIPDWKKQYINVIKQNFWTKPVYGVDAYRDYSYELAYIDDDEIPELVEYLPAITYAVSDDSYDKSSLYHLYSYKDGVVQVYDLDQSGNEDSYNYSQSAFEYLERRNLILLKEIEPDFWSCYERDYLYILGVDGIARLHFADVRYGNEEHFVPSWYIWDNNSITFEEYERNFNDSFDESQAKVISTNDMLDILTMVKNLLEL